METGMETSTHDLTPTPAEEDVFTTPDLPGDKEYHAMFSFQTEDRRWVRKIHAKLEAEPYHLKCCISDRDFHPGKEVITNIEMCMQQSMSTILIISPDHLESSYCSYETNIALEMMHQRTGKLIPVLRRGDEMPASLRFINYIDARDDIDDTEVVHKLAIAIVEGVATRSPLYNVDTNKNGREIRITGLVGKYIDKQTVLPQPSEEVKRTCKVLGIKINISRLNELYDLVNSSAFMLDYWWFYRNWGIFAVGCMISFFFASLTLFVMLSCTVILQSGDVIPVIAFPAVGVSGFILLIVIIPLTRSSMNRDRKRLSAWISERTLRQHCIVCIGDKDNIPCLRLIHYDPRACLNYIQDKLINEDVHGFTLEKRTTAIIQHVMPEYLDILTTKTETTSLPRHPVRGDIVCLCQVVESRDIHLKYSGKMRMRTIADRIFKCCRNATSPNTPVGDNDRIPLVV